MIDTQLTQKTYNSEGSLPYEQKPADRYDLNLLPSYRCDTVVDINLLTSNVNLEEPRKMRYEIFPNPSKSMLENTIRGQYFSYLLTTEY
jgi:hypothetical protein